MSTLAHCSSWLTQYLKMDKISKTDIKFISSNIESKVSILLTDIVVKEI